MTAIHATNTRCELSVTRNGSTGYKINLVTEIGSSATVPDLRTGKNLAAVRRSRTCSGITTRVLAKGVRRKSDDPVGTIGNAYHKVSAVSGSDLTLTGVEGLASPIILDDQFNGLYWVKKDGSCTLISDTVASTSKITVASAAGISANDWGRFASDSSGTELKYLDAPGERARLAVVSSGTYSGLTNLVRNPTFSTWTGAASDAPDGYTKTLGGATTFTRETSADYRISGLYSAKVVLPAFGSFTLRTSLMDIVSSASSPRYNFFIRLRSTVALDAASGDAPQAALLDQAAGGIATGGGNDVPADTWTTIGLRNVGVTSKTGLKLELQVSFAGSGLSGTVYVDSFMVYRAYPDPPPVTFYGMPASVNEDNDPEHEAFIVGSDAARLFALCNAKLLESGTTATTYRAELLDLTRDDPTRFPYDALTVGGTVNIRDTTLDVTVSRRLVERTRNLIDGLATTCVFGTRPVDLTGLLTGIIR